MLSFLTKNRGTHPLTDPKSARSALAGLSTRSSQDAVHDLCAWLESLAVAELHPVRRVELVLELDEAGAAQARRIAHDYLASRLDSAREFALWQTGRTYWQELVRAYEHCVRAEPEGEDAGLALDKVAKPLRAPFLARMINAYANLLKWDQFRYGPVDPAVWQHAGATYLAAIEASVDRHLLRLYPKWPGETSVEREYLKLLVFDALSMGNLHPPEIELAERLIAHFIEHFTLSVQAGPESVFWADAKLAQGPRRLVRIPEPAASRRYVSTGAAHGVLDRMRQTIELHESVPAELALGGSYSAEIVAHVLSHLASCCAPVPPQRTHPRIAATNRLLVVHGLPEIVRRLNGLPGEVLGEHWDVDDVSRSGFRANLGLHGNDWLEIGTLIGMQPEDGDKWLIGVVRRMTRDTPTTAVVGIETLCFDPLPVNVNCEGLQSVGLLLDRDVHVGAYIRMILSEADWEPYAAAIILGKNIDDRVRPMEALESGSDYVIGSYRVEPSRYLADLQDQ